LPAIVPARSTAILASSEANTFGTIAALLLAGIFELAMA
jgi:hypothetical protein